jgi:antitoxin MazE
VKTKVQKWGNSLGVRIPRTLAEEAAVAEGSVVDLAVDRRGRLIVSPERAQRYELQELLARITDDNLHGETWDDGPHGREAW